MPVMRGVRGWLASAPVSGGVLVIIAATVVSTWIVATGRRTVTGDLELWTFAREHALIYEPVIDRWNAAEPIQVRSTLFSPPALERRMLSSFLAQTPSADLIEIERGWIGNAFKGPVESIGFTDLTDLVEAEDLLEQINPPSFAVWMSRGRIFGLPHDVHPVMLVYHADIVESAGIDVSAIETWDDFERLLAPLAGDLDGDGETDRYLLAFWPTERDKLELLLLQAGGGLFDAVGRMIVASEVNARVLARTAAWTTGPGRVATEIPDFTESGAQQKAEARAVAYFAPDWMCNLWKRDVPGAAGTMKLMPLPAWEPGGRRTSVWGGTMLGIPRTTARFDDAWTFAKHLYLAEATALETWRVGGIITPVKEHWDHPAFAQPDAYFSGQAIGSRYIDLAEDIPPRFSHPFTKEALFRVVDALYDLRSYAEREGIHDPEGLLPEARRQLERAAADVRRSIDRNVFMRSE